MAKGALVADTGSVQALCEFTYDTAIGLVDRGQVFRLKGYVNDSRLKTFQYVADVAEGTSLYKCGECGREFISDHARTVHGDIWHYGECDCGWQPPADVVNPRKAMAEHRQRCELIRDIKRDAHERHVSVVTAQPVSIAP